MSITPLSLRPDYWETFEILDSDIEFLYSHLLEIETPQTPQELALAIISNRVSDERQALEKQQQAGGTVYAPKGQYTSGQALLFPALDWKKGQVTNVRPGTNPELPPFDVIEVKLESGETKQFAANLAEHKLNQPLSVRLDDPNLDPKTIIKVHGPAIVNKLTQALEDNEDLVRIAGRWFPRALLVDVNIGHLNLAEAVLDMDGGGPLTTKAILDQIELPTDVNLKLTEFSLNLALQEDGRFDEVGPAGEVLWFLRRLEPEPVKEPPVYLRFRGVDYDRDLVRDQIKQFDQVVCDELESEESSGDAVDEIRLSLIFPHWRAGTLPLCGRMNKLFPSAYESPRVIFTFVDGDSGQRIDGWVVRSNRYAYGLRDWYISQGLFPGSLLKIRKGKNQGEVIVTAEKRRPAREWIRTALIGADGGVVFAMLKQMVVTHFDDRLAVAIPDSAVLDQMWEQGGRPKGNLEQTVINMMRELAKLNPQGHVHAQELYAAVNLVRRCPPGPILSLLVERPWSTHLGDLYFRLDEAIQEEKLNG